MELETKFSISNFFFNFLNLKMEFATYLAMKVRDRIFLSQILLKNLETKFMIDLEMEMRDEIFLS